MSKYVNTTMPNDLIKSGVTGLDEILGGGIKKNSSVLITGGPGTGKTILTLQFLQEGVKNKEQTLFITSEQSAEGIIEVAKRLNLNYITKENKFIRIHEQDVITKNLISLEEPISIIKKEKIKRVVLDSITLFDFMYGESKKDFRKGVLSFIKNIKKYDTTLLITSERPTTEIDQFKHEPEDFLFDGLIILTKIRKGSSYERCLTISKMRYQDHSMNIYPFTIQKNGVIVHTKEIPFSLIEKDIKKKVA